MRESIPRRNSASSAVISLCLCALCVLCGSSFPIRRGDRVFARNQAIKRNDDSLARTLQTKIGGTHMFALFAQARQYAPLSPGQRAILKLAEGLLCAALVAALPVVADALGRGAINWADIGRTALAAAAVAVLLALAKYLKAHGDPQLGATLDTLGA